MEEIKTTIEKKTTRVQVEKAGPGCFIYQWYEGWRDGLQPAPDRRDADYWPIFEVMNELEGLGFAVWMRRPGDVGFALRGKITRIDFYQVGNRVRVDKYPYGWTLSTPPISSELKPEGFEIEQALQWFEHPWIVRTWPGGARAWFGKLIPVRTRTEIQRRRDKLSERFSMGGLKAGEYQIDLAFDM